MAPRILVIASSVQDLVVVLESADPPAGPFSEILRQWASLTHRATELLHTTDELSETNRCCWNRKATQETAS